LKKQAVSEVPAQSNIKEKLAREIAMEQSTRPVRTHGTRGRKQKVTSSRKQVEKLSWKPVGVDKHVKDSSVDGDLEIPSSPVIATNIAVDVIASPDFKLKNDLQQNPKVIPMERVTNETVLGEKNECSETVSVNSFYGKSENVNKEVDILVKPKRISTFSRFGDRQLKIESDESKSNEKIIKRKASLKMTKQEVAKTGNEMLSINVLDQILPNVNRDIGKFTPTACVQTSLLGQGQSTEKHLSQPLNKEPDFLKSLQEKIKQAEMQHQRQVQGRLSADSQGHPQTRFQGQKSEGKFQNEFDLGGGVEFLAQYKPEDIQPNCNTKLNVVNQPVNNQSAFNSEIIQCENMSIDTNRQPPIAGNREIQASYCNSFQHKNNNQNVASGNCKIQDSRKPAVQGHRIDNLSQGQGNSNQGHMRAQEYMDSAMKYEGQGHFYRAPVEIRGMFITNIKYRDVHSNLDNLKKKCSYIKKPLEFSFNCGKNFDPFLLKIFKVFFMK
jgi:hypothetical protein